MGALQDILTHARKQDTHRKQLVIAASSYIGTLAQMSFYGRQLSSFVTGSNVVEKRSALCYFFGATREISSYIEHADDGEVMAALETALGVLGVRGDEAQQMSRDAYNWCQTDLGSRLARVGERDIVDCDRQGEASIMMLLEILTRDEEDLDRFLSD
jgi:hypothetical protein